MHSITPSTLKKLENCGRVAIVGAGIAGLSAASRLADLGVHDVTLLDMGTRVVGGRSCSRILDDQSSNGGLLGFDHGLQFIAPKRPDFQEQVEHWARFGVVMPWEGRFRAFDALNYQEIGPKELGDGKKAVFCGAIESSGPLFVGAPTMGSLAQHMSTEIVAKSDGCHVRVGYKVTGLEYDGGRDSRRWKVSGTNRSGLPSNPMPTDEDLRFDAVIVADALALLPDSAGFAPIVRCPPGVEKIVETVQTVRHDPVFSLMVAFRKPRIDVPFDGAAYVLPSSSSHGELNATDSVAKSHPFQWISRDSSKPGRNAMYETPDGDGVECWVAITSTERAREILDLWPLHIEGVYNPQTSKYREEVAQELLHDFLEVLEKSSASINGGRPCASATTPSTEENEVVCAYAQRWGRGFVTTPLPHTFLGEAQEGFAVCGDFFQTSEGSPVERAWRSGRLAGEAVASWFLAQ